MRTFFFKTTLLLLLASFQLQAQVEPQWFLHQTAKVGFWYPDNWQLEQEDNAVRVQHTASGLSVTFSLLEDTQMEAALQDLEAIVAEQVQNPQWSSAPDLIELNGLLGVGAEVQGSLEGKPIQMGLFLIERPNQVLLVVGMGYQSALQEHRSSLDQILQSIKPL